MKLIFTEWNAGHDGVMPDPVEVNSVEHAEKIMWIAARATRQSTQIEAKVVNDDGELLQRFFATDDHVTEAEPEEGDEICEGCGYYVATCDCDGSSMVADILFKEKNSEPGLVLNVETMACFGGETEESIKKMQFWKNKEIIEIRFRHPHEKSSFRDGEGVIQ